MPDLSDAQSTALADLLRIAPVVGRLGETFATAGYELYLVGGSVRDALLGRLGNDLDFTTDARPEEIERLLTGFARAIRGASVWSIGKDFGTIGAKIPAADRDDWIVEITTFRSDIYRLESRKPEVSFGDNLEDDLVRRDFTVNAMAMRVGADDVPVATFRDPFGGLDDLADGVLRTPGTPEQSFSDDPLRMLRAARFAAQLELTPAPQVVTAMSRLADRIKIISAERVRDELTKLLLGDAPRPGLMILVATGLADHVLPELSAMRLEIDEHHRHKDVFEHSLVVLDQAIDLERRRGHQPDLANRLAALLHDVGKPPTRRYVSGNQVTFHHHDVVGAKMVRKRLTALRFPRETVDSVAALVELHLRFHGYGEGQWTDSAVRRYVRDAGPELERLHILTRADCTTRNRRKAQRLRRAYDDLEDRIDRLAADEELEAMRPDLNGDQIMEILQIPPGREVGAAYRHLLELRIENGPLGEDEARAKLLAWWADQR